MMEIQKIAESTTLADSESVKIALKRMKKVPTHELHYYLVARDTLQTTSPATRQAITLAQVESERRSANQTLSLAIIEPDPVFEIPPEPVPAPSEFKQRQSAIVIAPPVAKMTPPPLNSADSNATQARIGAAGDGGLRLFNADGSIRLPEAGSANGTETAANPIEAGKARWAEMQVRGENPLDCQRSRFAAAYAPDESLGDKVSRKYLKWIGLADPAGIAERAAAKQARAADGCDPVRP